MGEFHRGAWAYPWKRQSGEDLHSPVAFVRRALGSAMKLEDDGSTTEATNNNVPGTTIGMVNRWRKREAAKGTEPGLLMRQVYTDALAAMETTLRYSQSL